MDMGHIQMTIDRDAGELAYRQYHSNKLVNDTIYIFTSKLTPEDEVFYSLYTAHKEGGGKTHKVAQQTVSLTRFHEIIKELAEKLSTIEPDTSFVENHDGHMAIAKVENSETGEETFEVLSGKKLKAMSSLQRLKDRMDKVGKGQSIEINSPEEALEVMKGIAELISGQADGETQMFIGKVDQDEDETLDDVLGKIQRAQKAQENKPKQTPSKEPNTEKAKDSETPGRLSKFME